MVGQAQLSKLDLDDKIDAATKMLGATTNPNVPHGSPNVPPGSTEGNHERLAPPLSRSLSRPEAGFFFTMRRFFEYKSLQTVSSTPTKWGQTQLVRAYIFVILVFICLAPMDHLVGNPRTDADALIFDRGFELTRPIHSMLIQHPEVHDVLCLMNTAGFGLLILYAAIQFHCEFPARALHCLLFICAPRAFGGFLTSFPVSSEYVFSRFEWPAAGGAQAFVCFFSGHMYVVTQLLSCTLLSVCF